MTLPAPRPVVEIPGEAQGAEPDAAESYTATERLMAELLADVTCVEHISAESHFFDDLGANSLTMAHFCARVRKHPELPSVSIRDVYGHPTLRSLAAALTKAPATPAAPSPPAEPVPPGSTFRYTLCGALQLLLFAGYCLLATTGYVQGYEWVADASGFLAVYLRSAVFGALAVSALCVLPVAAKWLLIGRWKPVEFPVWGPAYLRFWIVKALLRTSPMLLFVGNPLYVLYLRALGARIGPGVTVLSRTLPVCTDLLTIGAGTVIRKDSSFLCYRARAGRIRTGPVTLGRDVFVGEHTVLDIGTALGDGSQLGHSSALRDGESVPAGESWHGSPARRTDVDHIRVAPLPCGTLRRAGYGLTALLQALLLYVPLTVGGTCLLLTAAPALHTLLDPASLHLTTARFYAEAATLSLALFAGSVVAAAVAVFVVPRLLRPLVKPDRTYRLYGFHYSVHRTVARLTNLRFFTWLCGDSSYIVPCLGALGYDLSHVEQTGSNFGTEVRHETPYLVKVGAGTMVADGLSVMNADYSSTSFRVSRTAIGGHNFLGNAIAYPVGGRTGENCLLATKVLVPLDGEIREGVGLLGSPPFEIPRSVERDSRFDHLREGEELRRRLAAKNRFNLRSMGLFLFLRWLHAFALTVLGFAAFDLYGHGDGPAGLLALAALPLAALVFTVLYHALVERSLTRFRPLRPRLCSIYDPVFWRQERLWKLPDAHLEVLNGTPYKSLVWRLLGVRIGRRVFDDGVYITERTLTAVGDDCTLAAGSKIQAHSQEDGTFKSDHVTIGAGSTLEVGAFVHYGVVLGEGAVLAPDSFLMKGEEVPPHARWGGNPATENTGTR
ncbi:Pls/PosA family non-ribosomal peptide synthetase [Streptomyces stelliscabiei]|uniref:Non-ribosomal peptide synthetase-like protein n=1 Tax=Streptomyces stelliscabiei TaxID=146820 RepID=A0A8I0TTD6_9ACTN|nr:Pls/PosA family non-ribosomal peptide synthetase [Streptomyces stelliscabiei]MBE1601055.1 non-ribosomal peptide synthetase-like protein [Streptomyces stelliscabiei]MDX2518430.1 phosphopantetheine-binding protein [Streptomyces stelliscabiei]MDX2551861.1 phosphopantetheine-binding protein [Streptomyces stelliscabiei]MDX2614535.1 phosphopantetheine-binding protein [Streptomyces stelliscabiei]MDX2636245.1 phosphopantetheine-binding protein [Streptomyces stelliscabiei]